MNVFSSISWMTTQKRKLPPLLAKDTARQNGVKMDEIQKSGSLFSKLKVCN